jgi:hypothetical protein
LTNQQGPTVATLWIREYSTVPQVEADTAAASTRTGDGQPMAQEPGTDQTPVTFTTSAQSAAFSAATQYIAMIASAAFHYVVGANPTATTSALKIPADTLVYIGVPAGSKIAAIAAV